MSSSDSSFSVARKPGQPCLLVPSTTTGKLTLLLGLLLGLLSTTTTGSSTTGSRGSGGTATGADVGKKILHVLALESLWESPSAHRLFAMGNRVARCSASFAGSDRDYRTLAKSEAQMGSTSSTPAALMMEVILSACGNPSG
jgi:hypothetical protein